MSGDSKYGLIPECHLSHIIKHIIFRKYSREKKQYDERTLLEFMFKLYLFLTKTKKFIFNWIANWLLIEFWLTLNDPVLITFLHNQLHKLFLPKLML